MAVNIKSIKYNPASMYVNAVFLRNACYNDNGRVVGPSNIVCFKIGVTSRADPNKRFKEHLISYDAIESLPLLRFHTNHPHNVEKYIEQYLCKYKIKLQCSTRAQCNVPHELYIVSDKVLNLVKACTAHNNIGTVFENDDYQNFDSLCDFLWNHYEKINAKEHTTLTVMDSVNDSLTTKQRKIFSEHSFLDAHKILGLPNKSKITE